MPGGRVHNALTLATLSGVLAPYLIVQFNANPWLYASGVAVGLLVSPDLDLNNGNVSDSMIRKVFPPAQTVWRLAWSPYSKLVPHRHPISHFPFLGTVLRIGYLLGVVNVFSVVTYLVMKWFGLDDSVSVIFFWNWSFVFGLCHADIVHWAVDHTIRSKDEFTDQ